MWGGGGQGGCEAFVKIHFFFWGGGWGLVGGGQGGCEAFVKINYFFFGGGGVGG